MLASQPGRKNKSTSNSAVYPMKWNERCNRDKTSFDAAIIANLVQVSGFNYI